MFSTSLNDDWGREIARLLILVLGFLLVAENGRTEALEKTVECLVCGKSHNNADHKINYKGMGIPLCSSGCLEHYKDAKSDRKLDPITAKIEPRAALFQDDSNPKDPLAKLFFWFGYYVLFGLVFGGATSYLAIQKGCNPWSSFLFGFLLNILGFVVVFMKPKQKMQFSSEGLTKVPKTRNEIFCSKCGHSNHPSAKNCNECGQKTKGSIRSEVQAVGLRKGV